MTYNRAFSTPANFSFFLDLPQAFIPITSTIGYQVRGLGVPSSGFTYRRNCTTGAGQLCMRSPFPVINPANPAGAPLVAPNTSVDANAAQYYRTLVGGNQTAFITALIQAGVTAGQRARRVRRDLRRDHDRHSDLAPAVPAARPRKSESVASSPVEPSSVEDLERLKATTTDAYELGYKGILGNRARLAIDLWYQRKTNFTTAAQNVTPNAFLDPTTLSQAIGAAITPPRAGRARPGRRRPQRS